MDNITMNVSEKKILRTKPLLRTEVTQIFLKYHFCSLKCEKNANNNYLPGAYTVHKAKCLVNQISFRT